MSCMEQGDAGKFLKRFLEDFPNLLGTEDQLPISPLSCKVSVQEVKGESLDLGLRLLSDSTAVVALLISDRLTVSWLGDSQAMLVQRGEPVTLMDPHKPEREDEKKRIEKLGGCIAFIGCWTSHLRHLQSNRSRKSLMKLIASQSS